MQVVIRAATGDWSEQLCSGTDRIRSGNFSRWIWSGMIRERQRWLIRPSGTALVAGREIEHGDRHRLSGSF